MTSDNDNELPGKNDDHLLGGGAPRLAGRRAKGEKYIFPSLIASLRAE